MPCSDTIDRQSQAHLHSPCVSTLPLPASITHASPVLLHFPLSSLYPNAPCRRTSPPPPRGQPSSVPIAERCESRRRCRRPTRAPTTPPTRGSSGGVTLTRHQAQTDASRRFSLAPRTPWRLWRPRCGGCPLPRAPAASCSAVTLGPARLFLDLCFLFPSVCIEGGQREGAEWGVVTCPPLGRCGGSRSGWRAGY